MIFKRRIEPENIHLIGVACMFLAAKYEEIYPFKMRHVYEKIGHKKLPKSEVKKQEADICNVLGFNLSAVTAFDFTMNALSLLKVEKSLSKKDMKYLIKVCVYLSKMVSYDYSLIKETSRCELGAATLYTAFKVMDQLYKRIPSSMV